MILSLKNYVNVPSKSNKQKNLEYSIFLLVTRRSMTKTAGSGDPLVRGTNPRIRIRTVPVLKYHGSATLLIRLGSEKSPKNNHETKNSPMNWSCFTIQVPFEPSPWMRSSWGVTYVLLLLRPAPPGPLLAASTTLFSGIFSIIRPLRPLELLPGIPCWPPPLRDGGRGGSGELRPSRCCFPWLADRRLRLMRSLKLRLGPDWDFFRPRSALKKSILCRGELFLTAKTKRRQRSPTWQRSENQTFARWSDAEKRVPYSHGTFVPLTPSQLRHFQGQQSSTAASVLQTR